MFKILFAGLLFLIFTQNIYAFTKVNVKYKEVSETAYEEGEQIFTRPYFLEKGIQWKSDSGAAIYKVWKSLQRILLFFSAGQSR